MMNAARLSATVRFTTLDLMGVIEHRLDEGFDASIIEKDGRV